MPERLLEEVTVEDLTRRAFENERIEFIFVQGVEVAARTPMKQKREHLARVVARAVTDDAEVLEATAILRAYEELDEPELAALARLRSVEDFARQRVGQPDLDNQEVDDYNSRTSEISKAVNTQSTNEHDAIVSSLIRSGVCAPITYLGGGWGIARVTSFGRSLLGDLEEVTAWTP